MLVGWVKGERCGGKGQEGSRRDEKGRYEGMEGGKGREGEGWGGKGGRQMI